MRKDTICVQGGWKPDEKGAVIPPIYQMTSFVFKDSEHALRLFELEEEGYIYSRINNPTVEALEKRVAMLEGGVDAVALSSGQAAITHAILNLAGSGDHVVASSSLYGGTITLFKYTLSSLGIEFTFVDPADVRNFEKALKPNTKAIYAEILANPKNDMPDLEGLAELGKKKGIPTIIDSTVGAGFLVNPTKHGINVVVHSATKFLSGHGTSIGGTVVDGGNFPWEELPQFGEPDESYHGIVFSEKFGKGAFAARLRLKLLRDLGSCMSPFNAYLILLGMETLHLRMKRHCDNALKIAKFLESHPMVSWVNYPGLESHPFHGRVKKYFNKEDNGKPIGFGAILGFGVKGGYEAAKKVIENVKLIKHLANIGDARTLIIHPASTTHQQLSKEEREKAGVSDDFIRLVVGIEHPDDIIEDLDQAIRKAHS